MEETKKYLITAGPIGADRTYLNGEVIELDAKCAKRLRDEKKIVPVKGEAPKGGDDADGKKGAAGDEGQKGKEDESLKDKLKGSTKGGKK